MINCICIKLITGIDNFEQDKLPNDVNFLHKKSTPLRKTLVSHTAIQDFKEMIEAKIGNIMPAKIFLHV